MIKVDTVKHQNPQIGGQGSKAVKHKAKQPQGEPDRNHKEELTMTLGKTQGGLATGHQSKQ